MTDNQYVYILSRYPFYEGESVLMVSSSYDEIISHFTREFRKLESGYGLVVSQYEFGKLYDKDYPKTIRHIERNYNGKIEELK